MEDEFIRTYIDEVLKNIRQQVILVLIKPFTRVTIDFIADVNNCYISVYDFFSIWV